MNTFSTISKGMGVPVLLLTILAMMMVPLPPIALDTLFTFNIAMSLAILLTVIYVARPLDFGVFPTVLLVVTLLRLALNIASTRVVLLEGHNGSGAAGKVIQAFGDFVVGGNFAVGLVVFSILVIINFVVVTKGAGRVSEVTARFTLDAMPGKQMAIDADLNAGLLDQDDGEVRRFVLGAISETLANHRELATSSPSIPSKETFQNTETFDTPRPALPKAFPKSNPKVKSSEALPTVSVVAQKHPVAAPIPRSDWRLITLLKSRYALFDSPKGLTMLHLRNADQRVRFERILRTYEEESPPSQSLLIPEPIELEPLAAETLQQQLELLNRQGFAIQEFGRNFYRIESVPAWLEPSEAVRFVRDTIDMLRQRGSGRGKDELVWEAVAKLAAEESYRKDDGINSSAAQQLAEELLRCSVPHTSPSGKPTFSLISWSEWERRFSED